MSLGGSNNSSAPLAAFDAYAFADAELDGKQCPHRSPEQGPGEQWDCSDCIVVAFRSAFTLGHRSAPELDRQQIERLLAANAHLNTRLNSCVADIAEVRPRMVRAEAERDAANRRVAELEAAIVAAQAKLRPFAIRLATEARLGSDCPHVVMDISGALNEALQTCGLAPPSEPRAVPTPHHTCAQSSRVACKGCAAEVGAPKPSGEVCAACGGAKGRAGNDLDGEPLWVTCEDCSGTGKAPAGEPTTNGDK